MCPKTLVAMRPLPSRCQRRGQDSASCVHHVHIESNPPPPVRAYPVHTTRPPVGSNQVVKEHYGPLITPYEIFRCNLPAEGFLPTPVGASTGLIRDDRFHPRGGDFGVDEKTWQGGSRHTWPCHAMPWRVPQQHRVSRRSWSWAGRELCRCDVGTRSLAKKSFHGLGFEATTMKSYGYSTTPRAMIQTVMMPCLDGVDVMLLWSILEESQMHRLTVPSPVCLLYYCFQGIGYGDLLGRVPGTEIATKTEDYSVWCTHEGSSWLGLKLGGCGYMRMYRPSDPKRGTRPERRDVSEMGDDIY